MSATVLSCSGLDFGVGMRSAKSGQKWWVDWGFEGTQDSVYQLIISGQACHFFFVPLLGRQIAGVSQVNDG